MKPVIALVTARAARGLDEDEAPLAAALRAAGAEVAIADWDDPGVSWESFDLALLRSTWDYTERLSEFLAWVERVSRLTTLSNPAAVVRWNTDKHYLLELARAGVPTVCSRFLEPGADAAVGLDSFLAQLEEPELVAKPAVGAGSRDTHRYRRQSRAAALAHVRQLLDAGRSVLLQPYLGRVDEYGETALIFFAGVFDPTTGVKPGARGGASMDVLHFDPSTGVKPGARGGASMDVLHFDHAVRKGPMLPGPRDEHANPEVGARPLFVAEHITPRTAQPDELEVAARALAAIPHEGLLYARVDLIRDAADAPVLLELELTEPSLFFGHSPGSAARLGRAVLDRARSFIL